MSVHGKPWEDLPDWYKNYIMESSRLGVGKFTISLEAQAKEVIVDLSDQREDLWTLLC